MGRMDRLFIVAMLCVGLAAPGPAAAQVKRISIGSGGTGGVFFVIGGVMADIINKNVKGVQATSEVTGASVENLRRVGSKQMEMGIANADIMHDAYEGKAPFNKKLDILYGFNLHRSTIVMAVLESSGIKTVSDLRGKRFAVGPPGGYAGVLAERVLKVYGLTFNDIKRGPVSYTETVDAMKDGNLDGGVFQGAQPVPAMMDITATHKVRILPIEGEPRERLIKEYPEIIKSRLPAGMFKGIDYAVESVGGWSAVFFRKDLPSDLVYQITKVVWENRSRLVEAHPAHAAMSEPGAAVQAMIPMHPGAERYFREIGIIKK